MNRKIATGLAVISSSIAIATAPAAADLAPERYVTAAIATINGSGCPVNTASATIVNDGKQIGVTYSNFMVSTSGAIQQNCQLSIRVFVPNGFTYTVVGIQTQGEANIAAGATGVVMVSYYVQGGSSAGSTVTWQDNLTGPVTGNWTTRHDQAIQGWVFAPCGVIGNMNINTRMIIDQGTSTELSTMRIGTSAVGFNQLYSLAFKSCT